MSKNSDQINGGPNSKIKDVVNKVVHMQKLQSSSEKKKKLNKSLDWEQQCIPEVAEGDIFNREEDELFAELVQARRKLHCCDEKFADGFLTQDELKARETFADIQLNFQGKRIKHYLRQFNDVKQ